MDCTGILLALKLCAPDPAPEALAIANERPAAQCLTKSQARAVYKSSHLYWHTAARCWDDQPTRTRRYHAPKKPEPKRDAGTARAQVLPVDPNANPLGRRTKNEVVYPVLVAKQAEITSDMYALQKPLTEWPLLLDIDAAGPDPNNGIDGCCWPRLENLDANR